MDIHEVRRWISELNILVVEDDEVFLKRNIELLEIKKLKLTIFFHHFKKEQ